MRLMLALALSATAQAGEDSRIAVFAQESAVTRDLPLALAALSEITAQCEACRKAATHKVRKIAIPVVDLPLGATEDRVLGALNLERALSHGEKSRIFLARALLQKSQLVIMDESFAALDPESLKLCLECAFRRAQTLMVIAHP